MRKIYLQQWLLVLLLFLVGCRTETYSPDDAANARKSIKFRVIPESEIPQIITTLKAKTNNFKVPLRNHASSHGKTETAFGDVVTSYIIESTDGSSQVYYTFPILPSSGNDTSDTYNLEVKTENAEVETAKVLVYEPAADWILIGNNDYSVFSGNVSTYSLDGTLESSVVYVNGTGGCPPPCPDCPTQPQGPGNPNPPSNPGGGGTGGGGGNPSGNPGGDNPGSDPGNPGTPSVPGGDGPPPTPPAPPNNPPSGPSNGGECRVCVDWDPNTGVCKQTVPISCPGNFTANRIAAPTCGQDKDPGGGGVVVTTQDDPCTKIKTKFANTRFKEKIATIDKPDVFDYDHEMGFAAGYPVNTSVTDIQYQPMENSINTNKVKLPDGDQYFGYMHSHNNEEGSIKIFSHADLATFLSSCVSNAATHNHIGDAYAMVITSQGNYILQYTGSVTNFGIGTNTLKFWKAWYEREYTKLLNDDNLTQQNVEKTFMRFLNEKVKISGVELYQVDKNTGKASKINPDGTKTPCPN